MLSELKCHFHNDNTVTQLLGWRGDICTGVWHVRDPIGQLLSSGNQMDKVDGQLTCRQILDFPSTMVSSTMTEWPLNKCSQLLMVKRCVVAACALSVLWVTCGPHAPHTHSRYKTDGGAGWSRDLGSSGSLGQYLQSI